VSATAHPAARTGRPAWLWPAAFAIVVLLSRLPLVGGGYGSDDDAWRNAVAAVHMRALGHYLPSRVPGFPVFETILAALVPWGWLATNGAAILAGVVAAVLFLVLAERLRVRSPRWLATGFAFGGAVWVAAAQTMDYAFGIALLLGAYLALHSRRPVWAGVLLALAAGCRASNAALCASALLFLSVRRDGWRAGLAFLAAFGVAATAIFLPVLLSPAVGDLRAHAAYHVARAHVTPANAAIVVREAVVFGFGKLGAIVPVVGLAATALALPLRRRRPPGADPDRAAALAFEASAALVIAAIFLLVPYESAYLLPALPFVMLLAGRVLPRGWVAGWALVLTLETLVQPLFNVHRVIPGRLFLERAQRRADLEETQSLAALRPAAPTIYVVGRFRTHRLLLLDPGLERRAPAWAPFTGPGVALLAADRGRGYAAALTPQQSDSLRAAGWTVSPWQARAGPPR
jgi:hypothetical protein